MASKQIDRLSIALSGVITGAIILLCAALFQTVQAEKAANKKPTKAPVPIEKIQAPPQQMSAIQLPPPTHYSSCTRDTRHQTRGTAPQENSCRSEACAKINEAASAKAHKDPEGCKTCAIDSKNYQAHRQSASSGTQARARQITGC